jgi:ABC-type nitrate/sulfonate/bicarbonate transport system substrate-binding protein
VLLSFAAGWTTLIDWANAEDDATVRAVSIETTQEWDTLSRERNLYLPHLFMNDAARDQNPLAGYGADNVSKLKQISAKYDETQFFQKLQNSGFLLSKV